MNLNKTTSKTGLLLALGIFILINLVAALALSHLRLDLTENNLNTLSAGTRNILSNLDEPVTLRLYITEDIVQELPGVAAYAKQIHSLLKEYQLLSKGKIELEKINPLPFSEEEDEAVSAGLQGVPLAGGDTLYLGLSGHFGEQAKTISFFQPEREAFLEYDLSQLIYALTHPEAKVVGLLSAIPLQGRFIAGQGLSEPVMLIQQLDEQYAIRHLSQDELTIADEIDVLAVVDPHNLSEQALYSIDQYVLAGRPAIILVDPQSELQPPSVAPPEDKENLANRLLASWGVTLSTQHIVGDPKLAHQVTYRDKFGRAKTTRYLPWLAVGKQQYNADEILVNQLGEINLASAGALAPVAEIDNSFTPLISSSTQAGLIGKEQFMMGNDPARISANFKPGDEALVLAARLKGLFGSAFPEGAPIKATTEDNPEEEPVEKKDPAEAIPTESEFEHLSTGVKPANLVIVADTDLLQDRLWVQVNNFFGQRLAVPNAANLDFVANALEILSGSPDLISVRSRGTYQRPFELFAEIQQNAEQRYRAKEQDLLQKLDDTEQKLNELQQQRKDSGSANLTVEQQAEVDKFIADKVKTRKELRSVQYQLRADIVDLERIIKIFNIGLVPFLVSLTALITWMLRRNRERSY